MLTTKTGPGYLKTPILINCKGCGIEFLKETQGRQFCNCTCNSRYHERATVVIQERRHDARLLRKFGITLAEFLDLADAQDNRCAICQRECEIRTIGTGRNLRAFVVDHDHQTGQVRGLLCHDCNMGIGRLGDTLEPVEAAAAYLRVARQNLGSYVGVQ